MKEVWHGSITAIIGAALGAQWESGCPVAEIQQYRQYWDDGWGLIMKGLLVEYNASHQCYFIHHGFVVTCTFYLQFHKQDPYSF